MATHVDNQSAVPIESAKTTTANNEMDDKSLNLNTPNNNTAVITINVKNPETQNEVPNFMPAVPSPTPAERLYHEAAATHGGDETSAFLVQELNTTLQEMQLHQQQQQQQNKDATISRNPSTIGKYEKKIGHRRIDDLGDVTYKRIKSKQIMGSIQLGIQQTVGSLASKPKRDLLMNDFWEMETLSFPPEGSATTPAHHYSDFKFKVYAPIAFRYFRDLFGIAPDDFLMSMCAAPLLELSNPGASGSLFYVTNDDEFIIKTVQKKECEFLQKLLPGYYMNLSQNPRTLLPKFFGLYCFNYNTKNVRLVAMNNLLPSDMKMHAKYDLKGSTHGRKASKQERQKASPTFKDLDFMEHFPSGIFLETDKYNALKKTIERDCMVLESFQIMDYSLLVGVHNVDLAAKEKREERIRNARAKRQKNDDGNEAAVEQMQDKLNTQISNYNPAAAVAAAAASISSIGLAAGGASAAGVSGSGTNLNRSRSMNRQRVVAHSTPMESITADMEELEDVPAGGIPARSENDERLILYIGIIDILQSYRLEKKLEHTFKSIIYNGDTVSVCRPSFYSKRFQNFITKTVFRKTPTFPLKHSPSKRKSSTVSSLGNARFTPSRANNQSISHMTLPTRMQLSMGASTPPPAFDDISEEELTATSSSAFKKSNRHTAQRSHMSSVIDSDSDDDSVLATRMSPRSSLPLRQSLHLSKTSVQVTTIGCVEDTKMPPQANKQIIVINNNNDRDHEQFTDYTDNQQAVETAGDGGIINEQLVSTTKTTTVKAMKQATYTSTLVVNDVIS